MTLLPQELFLGFRIYSDGLRLDFQLFLYFMLGNDQTCSPEMEIVVEETASVREVRLAAPTALLPSSWTAFLAQNWRQRSWEEPCTEWRKLWCYPVQCWIWGFDFFKRCICKLWGRICSSKGTNWQHRFNFLPVWESWLSWCGEFLAWKPSHLWRV